MPLKEADTRARLIEPKLQAAGWIGGPITREHFYRRDHRYTAGRIYLIGDEARRREPRRVDYLLRYTDAFPIAVIEAIGQGVRAMGDEEAYYWFSKCSAGPDALRAQKALRVLLAGEQQVWNESANTDCVRSQPQSPSTGGLW